MLELFFFYYVKSSDCATRKNIKWEALTLINQDRMCFEALVIVTSQEDLLNVFFYSFSSDASQLSDETTFFNSCEKSIKWGSL